VAIIGTSSGLDLCRYVSEGSLSNLACPRLLVYAAIAFIYGCLPLGSRIDGFFVCPTPFFDQELHGLVG